MQISIVFLALIGYAYGGAVLHGAVGVLNTGTSAQFRSQDNIGNYAFGYNEDHSTGGTFRREQGGPGVQVGSYGLRDIDGRVRVVNYVADAAGFRANIQTNEPGVEPKDPAAVLINKAAAIVGPAVAAAPLVAGPVAVGGYGVGPVGYGAGLVHGGVGPVASYSTVTNHVAGVPAVYGGGLVAPGVYGGGLVAPGVYGGALGYAGNAGLVGAYATKGIY